MRIFVTAPDDTGTMRKTRLTLVDCTTSNDLLKRLSSLCNIHQQWIIAKIKQDLVNVYFSLFRSESFKVGILTYTH